jgi:Holliday junction resolvasome RuvABC endonuclease subunit
VRILGIDPDTKTTGLGIISNGLPTHGRLVVVPKRTAKWEVRRPAMVRAINEAMAELRFKTPDARSIDIIVVESQFIYPPKGADKGTKRPNDILHLAQIAGAALSAAIENYPTASILVPLPAEWKGTARKDAFTTALLKKLKLQPTARGLEFVGSTARLPGTTKLAEKDATHVIDALGLARWAHMRTPR